MKLVLAILTLLLLPAPSDACSQRYVSIFERFDLATTVAQVRVGPIPPRGAGKVTLAVKRVLKGNPKARTLTTFESNSSCSVGYKRNQTAFVFLYADGGTVGSSMGYVTDLALWQPTLDAWVAANDVARRGILVAAIVKNDESIAYDAADYLVNEPSYLVKIDADQRAQLAAVTPATKYSALPHVMTRLKGGKYEAIADAAKLAAIIAAGKGEKDPDRIAALERCERVHGKRLATYTSYREGVSSNYWPKLAEACKTGTPPTP